MSLNIEGHNFFFNTTYNLFKKIKRHMIFLVRYVFFFEIQQRVIFSYNI